ncbi:glycoside hydrolase family 65 protein [Spiroplasma culicicola]|uniref:Maltose phosphorylase n=1 Tax=Spiroplasma culicicola AES-1 TaxID=1276246 RepID=W6AGH9_9MOLU|nr:glycoside hydrolase family 65 protein [Spiroplasma culicicola]AHI52784.1 maltose phosphorylase [Spiroplasma culicicola AES-1]
MNLKVEYTNFNPNNRRVEESNLTIANGYIGMRGSFEEGTALNIDSVEGTYLNAFYDFFDITYAAKYTGYPDLYQRMVPLVNMQNLELLIDNQRYLFDGKNIENYNLRLDMTNGQLIRTYKLNLNNNEYIEFEFKKMLSQVNYELFLQNININFCFNNPKSVQINFPVIFKELDVDKGIPNDPRNKVKGDDAFKQLNKIVEKSYQAIEYQTINSDLKMVYATKIKGLEDFEYSETVEGMSFSKTIEKQSINIEKTSIMYDQRFEETNLKNALTKLEEYCQQNYSFYVAKNELFFNEFWLKANSFFGTKNDKLHTANNFNMFQLYTNIGKLPWTNVAAKGLSGEGYAGHYFWDSEIYIITALTLFDPQLARAMLMFRYNTLDGARNIARLLNHPKGALYPWRTINGNETSTYYPAGTAQYHINGDISYTIINYFKATKDEEFLFNYGIDVLVETARVWADKIVVYNGQAHINSVTGPDEYQIIVNDDYWTNCVAQFNLNWAVKVLEMLKESNQNLYEQKIKDLKIDIGEVNLWKSLAPLIYFNYDQDLDLNPQHDNFMKRKPVTKEIIEKHKPFLRKLHPLSINSYRVTKQADVVLANLFFYDKNKLKTMENNWHFYDSTDTADSSLSKCIYAIMAARLKIDDFGFEYFKESINLDLYDTHKNTDRGLHMANMAGVRMFIIYGLLGINIEKEYLEIDPRYNDIIDEYNINVVYQNVLLNFSVKNKKIMITTNEKQSINIKFKSQIYTLEKELELTI